MDLTLRVPLIRAEEFLLSVGFDMPEGDFMALSFPVNQCPPIYFPHPLDKAYVQTRKLRVKVLFAKT